jgi:hypothetical protein
VSVLRRTSEDIARKTSRRSLFGKGAGALFGLLAGAAAGSISRSGGVQAGANTICAFPFGDACPCEGCQSNGVCAKPCIIYTFWYIAGCWTTAGVTCCDCDCVQLGGGAGVCGCGTDYHNNSQFCPP